MTQENFRSILTDVLRSVVALKEMIKTEDADTDKVCCEVRLKGEKSGDVKIITITVDKEENVNVDGDVLFIDVIKDAVNSFLKNTK